MSYKLTYELDGQTFEKTVKPLGTFSLVESLENHRYKEELNGEMVFRGEDYDFIMGAGDCTSIYITCYWRKTFRGKFTHRDCQLINKSKRYIEVIPKTDDLYSKFEPYLQLDLNIIPPYEDIKTNTFVGTVRQYEIERKTVRIGEPYDGENAENWQGYSVNDNIRDELDSYDSPEYHENIGRLNSLIWFLNHQYDSEKNTGVKMTALWPSSYPGSKWNFYPTVKGNVVGNYYAPYVVYSGDSRQVHEASEQFNQLMWLDYAGYQCTFIEDGYYLHDFASSLRRSGMFTLTEVINYYDENEEWEYCELIYTREVYREGRHRQPHGNSDGGSYEYKEGGFFTGEEQTWTIGGRGWVFLEDEDMWVRRPIDIMWRFNVTDWVMPSTITGLENFRKDVKNHIRRTGDGNWFTPLIKLEEGGKTVRKQWLYVNRYQEEEHGDSWYFDLYGSIGIKNRFQRIDKIFEKFIQYIKEEGMGLGDLELQSQHLTAETHPYTGDESDWALTLVGQNSDVKRPMSTEAATEEEFTFKSFLDTICDISNAAWAVLDVEGTPTLVIEHIKYFENGLQYEGEPPIINPNSIENIAKNKGFMNLTDRYSYDKSKMPQFEKFETIGGEQPINNKAMIKYESDCVNTKPGENTDEYTIDTTTDYSWIRREGDDRGITLIRMDEKIAYFPAYHEDNYAHIVKRAELEAMGFEDDTINKLSDHWEMGFDVYVFMPQKRVIEGDWYRYVFNAGFTLEDIIRAYHDWGRSYKKAKLNNETFGTDNRPLTPMYNMVQNVSFPYKTDSEDNLPKKLENPYAHIMTNLGLGIINRREYMTKSNLLEFELGLREVEPTILMDYHVHTQDNPSRIWDIEHDMGTGTIMRPIVMKEIGGEWHEVEYNQFVVVSSRKMRLEFTKPITGRANFLSLRAPEKYRFKGINSSTWEIEHNLDADPKYLVFSAVLIDGQREVKYNSLEHIDNNNVKIEFVKPVTGEVVIADMRDYAGSEEYDIVEDVHKDIDKKRSSMMTKPIVFHIDDKEIEYDYYNTISDSLFRMGFSKEVTAKIIVTRKSTVQTT